MTGRGNRRRHTQARAERAASWQQWRERLANLPWRGPAGIAGVAVALLLLGWGGRLMLDQPVQRIVVEGRFQRVLPPDVELAVRAVSDGQGLLATDLHEVGGAVRALPWVDQASVGRRWPNGLVVHVVEEVPVARWGANGLVNARGEVFIDGLRDVPAELPALRGPEGTAREVTRRFLAMRGSLVEQGLGLARLSLDARGAWEVVLDNGVVLRLGRHDVDGRFERFLAAAARMAAERADGIAYIDLRYASGFAVGPRTAGGAASGQAS